MSVIAYARMTSRRERSRPERPGSTLAATTQEAREEDRPAPVGQVTIDAFAALVPAEILVAHATILQLTTETKDEVTTITESGVLKAAFWGLIIASLLVYLIAKAGDLDRLDIIRVFIPPVAFVGWTMVQKTTAFDAAFSMNEALRFTIPVIAALVVTVGATALAYQADKKKG